MDFQTIVDGIPAMTCAVSVETFDDDRPGVFRIVAGNKPYVDSIEHPQPGMKMLRDMFVPGSEYTDYLTRDLNFEDYCYRAAVEKKCLHSYVHPDRMDVWLNMMFIPLWEEGSDLHYCLYIMEANMEADVESLSNTSSDIAMSVLDTCIRLRGTNDFNASMKEVIAGIRDLCDGEHCCILIMDERERSCSVLGESFAEGSPLLPMETYINPDFYDIAESWNSTIAGSNCLIAKDEHDMMVVKERNPVWYESLTAAGVHNIALFPLKSRNQLLGYMWTLNFDQTRAEKIKETLEVTTFIVGSEIGNYLLLDRLRTLSSKDLLTGVMNRNEMNNYVAELCHVNVEERHSVGVIFADLNGLKAVNDIEGHGAGDMLLKNAANVLREVFDETCIFRAGGDEFSIITTDVTQEELDAKIEQVRKGCEKYDNLAFALGGSVEEDCRNVRMALRHADENMYEDKRLFYEQNPDRVNENRIGHSAEDSEVDADFRSRSAFREMSFDHLTGLTVMTQFFRYAEIARKSLHDRGVESAVVFVNLGGMKYYNKKYGFAEGDVLIRDIAIILGEVFGEENCSRFGQDHFALFTEAEGLEQRLRRVFAEAKRANGGRALPVRAGVYPDSMGLIETSLACDRAKSASESKQDENDSYFVWFDDKMLSKENNRQYIVDHLDQALSENWIKPFFQPIVRATTRKVCEEEALARWIDPERGMLSPADFIPVLEETKLIYKVDLHIVDYALERIKNQKKDGVYVVPISINLSRTDFETCDIVEEIDNRVTAAGVSKDLITVEITESVIGENLDFMMEQVNRFRSLGFKVWMDDFGSGYSSLDLLRDTTFDLIKFDMRFMRQLDQAPKSKVLLTELMRMAQSLNFETVCEGVETEEQADFLSEIGCTKMQGFYFCKPIPLEEIKKRYKEGIQIGFENPDETEYHRTVGSINMYNLSSINTEEAEAEASKHYFDTLPMAILEYDGERVSFIRTNKAYREFADRFYGVGRTAGPELMLAIDRCREDGHREFLDEKTEDGTTIHAMIKKIIDNPVTGVSAYVAVVLQVIPGEEQQLTYADVAQALSSDYVFLYYVDTKTESFIEYSPDDKTRGITVERHGENFFSETHKDAQTYIYEADREDFYRVFTRENVLNTLDEQGVFVHTYRLMIGDTPAYVNMKIVRIRHDDHHIIIGVNNVDAQMRQQETIDRLKEEQTTYARITALMGDFIAIYSVDPDSGNYMEYSSSKDFSDLGTPKAGVDFYTDSLENIRQAIHPDDLDYFLSAFSKEKILEVTKSGRVYKLQYRLMIGGKPLKVSLRAGIVTEKDGDQLIIGVSPSAEEG